MTLSAARGLQTSLTAPQVQKPATIHVILEVQDRGSPSLVAYRRAITEVKP